VSALLAWTLFAFGGVYFWAAAATACGSVLLLAISRPTFFSPPGLRTVDALLLALLLGAFLQTVPLPPVVVETLSPNRQSVAAALALEPPSGLRPLSLNPAASFHALLVFGSAVVAFWSARGIFYFGGVRVVVRAVALFGLLAAVVGILQDASRTRLVYWWWSPRAEGAPGFGPFINRNHFAAWTVMALSLTIGYVAARTHAPDEMDRFRSFAARLRRRLDGRAIWLLAAIVSMTVALVVCLSRSGIAAAAVAVVAARMMVTGRHRREPAWISIAAASVVAIAILWTGPATLVDRWRAVEIGQAGRSEIWRETVPLVRDFWLAGTGVGTYGDAMTVYQRSSRDRVHFNQAHNHYLQLLAEAGALLFLLLAVAVSLFVRAARERLRRDHTGMLWLRTGAAAGLVGLAVSSIWETAARMPANALLAAVLAAIVVHEAHHHAPPTEGT
jgi:O-antigen ligase